MTMEKIKVVADFDWLENEETIGLLGQNLRGGQMYIPLSMIRTG
jgi:hypothetical protein